jgi:hypothetical protein
MKKLKNSYKEIELKFNPDFKNLPILINKFEEV